MSNRQQRRQLPQATAPVMIHQESSAAYSGPLPPAVDFARYEEVLTGAADRILTMAEKRGEDRRKYDDKTLDDKIRSGRRGQYCAFIIAMSSLVVITIISLTSQSTAAAIVPMVVACTSLAAVFIRPKK